MREGFTIEAARQLLASGATDASAASLQIEAWEHAGVLHGYPWCRARGNSAQTASAHVRAALSELDETRLCADCRSEISVRFDDPVSERSWLGLQQAGVIRARLARSGARRRTAISLGNLLSELCAARAASMHPSAELERYVTAELVHTDETIAMLRGELRAHEEELLYWVRWETLTGQTNPWTWSSLSRDIASHSEVPALRGQHRSQMVSWARRELSTTSARPRHLAGTQGARYQEAARKVLMQTPRSKTPRLHEFVDELEVCEREAAALLRVLSSQLEELSYPEMACHSWIVAHPQPSEGAQRAVLRLYSEQTVAVVPRIVGEWVTTLSPKLRAQGCALPDWASTQIIETAAGLWTPDFEEEFSSLRTCLEAARDILT